MISRPPLAESTSKVTLEIANEEFPKCMPPEMPGESMVESTPVPPLQETTPVRPSERNWLLTPLVPVTDAPLCKSMFLMLEKKVPVSRVPPSRTITAAAAVRAASVLK